MYSNGANLPKEEKPLVQGKFLLEKFPGKGGWTYAPIPEILQNPDTPFGWVTVRGQIDTWELKQVKLMPMGDQKSLFLPVKALIRKKIKKEAGDWVEIVLYAEDRKVEIPEEVRACFEMEEAPLWETFQSFPEAQRKAYLDWIYEAKTEESKAQRIVKMMERLAQKKRFYD